MNSTLNVNWAPGITLEQMEKSCILAALRFYRGNKTQTAHALGIAIRTLDHKIEKYEADAKAEEERKKQSESDRQAILNRMRGIPNQNGYGFIPPINSNPTVANANNGQSHQESDASSSVVKTDPGVRIQPASNAPAQPAMSMSQRQEVQSVLPGPTGSGRVKGRRG